MLHAIEDVLFAVSASWGASVVVKATALLALSLTAVLIARTRRAAVRHTILAAAFGALAILPLAVRFEPGVRIAVPTAAPVVAIATPVAAVATPITSLLSAPAPVNAVTEVPAPSLTLADYLLRVWIAGMLLFLLPMAAGLRTAWRLRRSGQPWTPSGLPFPGTRLLLSDRATGPMTCGFFRPIILLPTDAPNWDPQDLIRAIVHEREHVRRADWAIHCVARALCAVYWFHPLAWIAWRRLALEAELACDDAVLRNSDAMVYADQLVGLAQRLSHSGGTPLLAMASRRDLARRVGAVLDDRQQRGRAGVLAVATAWILAAAFVAGLSPLTLVAAPQSVPAPAHAMPEPPPAQVATPATPALPAEAALAPVATAPPPSAPERPLPALPATPVLLAQAAAPPPAPAIPSTPAMPPQPAIPPPPAVPATPAYPLPQFTANTSLVTIVVTAMDQSGGIIEGLNAGDFSITEDAKPQHVAVFEFQKVNGGTQAQSYYVIGYYSTNGKNDGAYRRIDVALRSGITGTVRHRLGYFSETIPPPTAPAFVVDGATFTGSGEISTPATLLRKFDPEYSEEARKAKYNGSVLLNVQVADTGDVTNLLVAKSLGLGLDEKAVQAVQRWKFRPAAKNGTPVASWVQVTVNFRLL